MQKNDCSTKLCDSVYAKLKENDLSKFHSTFNAKTYVHRLIMTQGSDGLIAYSRAMQTRVYPVTVSSMNGLERVLCILVDRCTIACQPSPCVFAFQPKGSEGSAGQWTVRWLRPKQPEGTNACESDVTLYPNCMTVPRFPSHLTAFNYEDDLFCLWPRARKYYIWSRTQDRPFCAIEPSSDVHKLYMSRTRCLVFGSKVVVIDMENVNFFVIDMVKGSFDAAPDVIDDRKRVNTLGHQRGRLPPLVNRRSVGTIAIAETTNTSSSASPPESSSDPSRNLKRSLVRYRRQSDYDSTETKVPKLEVKPDSPEFESPIVHCSSCGDCLVASKIFQCSECEMDDQYICGACGFSDHSSHLGAIKHVGFLSDEEKNEGLRDVEDLLDLENEKKRVFDRLECISVAFREEFEEVHGKAECLKAKLTSEEPLSKVSYVEEMTEVRSLNDGLKRREELLDQFQYFLENPEGSDCNSNYSEE
ncbi:hypothetical protein QR680_004330 [Steinernema hermaphroditum]|uniref:Uncharacterized protein n=1 Tax=Steinernema hermaphroditum TaxID=289476 RepID=A0AA39LTH6_9BILA|nr:hypothetical protein QR680_004330 [Steinernema hermaphroditum]